MILPKIFISLSVFLMALAAHATDCPLGKGETELTFTRVMLNFGKYTRNADFVSVVGQDNPTAVKESQLDSALVELPVAKACALAIVNDTTNAILPSGLSSMAEKDLQAYVEKLKARMNEFVGLLDVYFAELTAQKAKAEADRDYNKAYESSQHIKDWVGNVHEELKTK